MVFTVVLVIVFTVILMLFYCVFLIMYWSVIFYECICFYLTVSESDIKNCSINQCLFSKYRYGSGYSQSLGSFLANSNKNTPFVERRLKKRNNQWISPDIVRLMYYRDFLHKKAASSKDQWLWKEYQRNRNTVNSAITCAKKMYCDNAIDNNKKPPMMWKNINELIRDKKKKYEVPPD